MSDHSTAAAGRIDLQSDAQTTSLGIDAMSAVPTVHRLWRRALSLGAANAFDYVLQNVVERVRSAQRKRAAPEPVYGGYRAHCIDSQACRLRVGLQVNASRSRC